LLPADYSTSSGLIWRTGTKRSPLICNMLIGLRALRLASMLKVPVTPL
jgi:hypothetical protein